MEGGTRRLHLTCGVRKGVGEFGEGEGVDEELFMGA